MNQIVPHLRIDIKVNDDLTSTLNVYKRKLRCMRIEKKRVIKNLFWCINC